MCDAGTPRCRRGRARGPDMRLTIVGCWRCLRLRRPLQHLLLLETAKASAARLRGVIAGGAESAGPRSRRCRRHHPVASARRSFRRAAVSAARCATVSAARAPADHRRAARTRGRASRRRWRCSFRRVEQQVALSVRDRGDRGRACRTKFSDTRSDRRGDSSIRRAVDRAAHFRRRETVCLFRRHRLDRRADRRRRRRRSVHCRMLRLRSRRPARPHASFSRWGRSAARFAPGASCSRI